MYPSPSRNSSAFCIEQDCCSYTILFYTLFSPLVSFITWFHGILHNIKKTIWNQKRFKQSIYTKTHLFWLLRHPFKILSVHLLQTNSVFQPMHIPHRRVHPPLHWGGSSPDDIVITFTRKTKYSSCTDSKKTDHSYSFVASNICDAIWGNHSDVEHVTFSDFYLIELLIWRGTFCWKPHLNRTSGSKVMSNWRILKTIENKRNSFLFLAISHNQCSWFPNDSARLQHIFHFWCFIFFFHTMTDQNWFLIHNSLIIIIIITFLLFFFSQTGLQTGFTMFTMWVKDCTKTHYIITPLSWPYPIIPLHFDL